MTVPASIATARVDRLLGRTFSLAAFALSVESAVNFFSQLKYLNAIPGLILVGILWCTTIAVIYTLWFGSANYLFMRIHALYMPVLIFTWPFLLIQDVPQDGTFYPWIWWGVDTGWVAIALSFKWRISALYYIVCIGMMQLIFSLPMGGSHSQITLVTDSLYTSLTNACLSVIALLIRHAAQNTDKANYEYIQAQVLQAEAEAKARERLRLDGLIHDSVLTALIRANQAKTEEDAKASAELAAVALKKLSDIQQGVVSEEAIYCSELFDSIIASAKIIDPELEVRKNCAGVVSVPPEQATALTEATIQALHNSLIHAGPKVKRELSLRSTKSAIKIVIKDDGKGFRLSRVNKGRLGLKVSIIGRMRAAGGSAYINSAPGRGATVVLEWENKCSP